MYIDDSGSIEEKNTNSVQSWYDGDSTSKKNARSRILSSMRSLRNASNRSIRDLQHSEDEDRQSGTLIAGYNVTNLVQGIGILGVPFAVAQGSYVGLIAILVTAFVACTTGKMLIECLYDKNGFRVRKTYSCIGVAVWPKFGKQLVTAVSLIEMFGGNTLYVILLSMEGQKLMSRILGYEANVYYCTLILTYAGLPLFFVKRMSIVSWFSFAAVIGLAVTIVTLCAFCFSQFSHFSWSHNFPSLQWSTIPLSLGIITFSYCAHAAFPGIEGSMRKPSSFSKMMNVSFTIAAIVKSVMPLLFVLIYGLNTRQQVSINVDQPTYSIILGVSIIVNTFFSLPLTMFVVCERIDAIFQPHFHPLFNPNGKLNWLWLVFTRTMVITTSVFVAMMVPHFALMMGLVGSLTGSCLTFIFPCIFSLKLHNYRLTKVQKSYRVVVIIVGGVLGVLGAIVSLFEIINELSK